MSDNAKSEKEDTKCVITLDVVAMTSMRNTHLDLRTAFVKGIHDEELIVSISEPTEDINGLAKARIARLVSGLTDPVEQLYSTELLIMKNKILFALDQSIAMKVFVAAGDKKTFGTLFPALKPHFQRFHDAQFTIADTVVKFFPCIKPLLYNYGYDYELVTVFDVIIERAEETKTIRWHKP